MPNIMIHEEVGYFVSCKTNISSYDFYLGILTPDAVNLEGFAEKEIRWTSHRRKKDLQDWKENLLNFYNQNKNKFPKDFILGYYIHILTDIIFDELLYLNVKDKILKDGFKEEIAHEIMGQDMNKFYFPEIEKVKEILNSNNQTYNILNIDEKLLLAWKNKAISLFSKEKESIYITDEVINILNQKVLEELMQENLI